MDSQDIKPSHFYKNSNKKCQKCGLTSKEVNHSKKFNQSLCIECLKEMIINSSQ